MSNNLCKLVYSHFCNHHNCNQIPLNDIYLMLYELTTKFYALLMFVLFPLFSQQMVLRKALTTGAANWGKIGRNLVLVV